MGPRAEQSEQDCSVGWFLHHRHPASSLRLNSLDSEAWLKLEPTRRGRGKVVEGIADQLQTSGAKWEAR